MAPESSVNLAGGSVADETKPSLKIRPLRVGGNGGSNGFGRAC